MRIFALIGCMFLSVSSYALGLGDISVTSDLNEPFMAEIPLLGAEEINEHELIVQLAGTKEFEQMGISRDGVLLGLRFAVDIKREVIVVNSADPIREPLLNFLLSVQSPKARLLKEYTVFLDPAR